MTRGTKFWATIIGGGLYLLLRQQVAFAVKPGAILGSEPAMEHARRIIAQIWARHGFRLTVTSGLDGSHSAQSKHYLGLAEDYRTRDVPRIVVAQMAAEIRADLGSDYDVVVESDHLHVEYDPK